MKRHWIHSEALEGRLYGTHDLSDLSTDCGLQVPAVLPQVLTDAVPFCMDCIERLLSRLTLGIPYCGPEKMVRF